MASIVPDIDENACDGCGVCVAVCPSRALEMRDRKAVLVRPHDCSYCTECEANCPAGAIGCGFEIVMAEESLPRAS